METWSHVQLELSVLIPDQSWHSPEWCSFSPRTNQCGVSLQYCLFNNPPFFINGKVVILWIIQSCFYALIQVLQGDEVLGFLLPDIKQAKLEIKFDRSMNKNTTWRFYYVDLWTIKTCMTIVNMHLNRKKRKESKVSYLQLQNFPLFFSDEFLLFLFTLDGSFQLLALSFLLFILDPQYPDRQKRRGAITGNPHRQHQANTKYLWVPSYRSSSKWAFSWLFQAMRVRCSSASCLTLSSAREPVSSSYFFRSTSSLNSRLTNTEWITKLFLSCQAWNLSQT